MNSKKEIDPEIDMNNIIQSNIAESKRMQTAADEVKTSTTKPENIAINVKVKRRSRCDEKIHICRYPDCGAAFARPYRLENHMIYKHRNMKLYDCDFGECSKKFTNLTTLKNHIKAKHLQFPEETQPAKPVKCWICLKFYSSNHSLTKHMKVIHESEKRIKCNICEEEFRTQNQLSAHLFQHTNIKAFKCTQCDQEFVTVLDLTKHKKRHKKSHVCKCKEVFLSFDKYKNHRRLCPQNQEFICDDCGISIKSRIKFRKHLALHSPISTSSTFPCKFPNCFKIYSKKFNLEQHMNSIHLNVKFECVVCQQSFTTKRSLKRHLQIIHIAKNVKKKKKIEDESKKERATRKDAGHHKVPVSVLLSGVKNVIKLEKCTDHIKNEVL